MGAGVGSGGPLTSVEICAGAGGQALGLHNAGFRHRALLEIDPHAVETLKLNAPRLSMDADCILQEDLKEFAVPGVHKDLQIEPGELDLLAGGVPCPPFSVAGKQLGKEDDRDLFPAMLDLIADLEPRAVMIENVRGLLDSPKFASYRESILKELRNLGYHVPGVEGDISRTWRIMEARNFGVPQLRPRAILVAIRRDLVSTEDSFTWPVRRIEGGSLSVYDALLRSMEERCSKYGAKGARVLETWKKRAGSAANRDAVAPTLVGGSKKHGGADLGPTRAKRAWAELGIDAMGVANDPEDGKCVPERDLFRETGPMLTVKQAAIIQGFPESWQFFGGKTARYRQVGNAFPPPVAEAVGRAIVAALRPGLRDAVLENYVMEDSLPSEELETAQLDMFDSEGIEPVPA